MRYRSSAHAWVELHFPCNITKIYKTLALRKMKQVSHTYGHPSSYLSNNNITSITVENIYWVLAVCHIPDGNNYTNHKRNRVRHEKLGSRSRKPVDWLIDWLIDGCVGSSLLYEGFL